VFRCSLGLRLSRVQLGDYRARFNWVKCDADFIKIGHRWWRLLRYGQLKHGVIGASVRDELVGFLI